MNFQIQMTVSFDVDEVKMLKTLESNKLTMDEFIKDLKAEMIEMMYYELGDENVENVEIDVEIEVAV